MRNCIYASGHVVSLEEGPCNPLGLHIEDPLIDEIDMSESIEVLTEAPSVLPSWLPVVAVAAIALVFLNRR